MTTNLLSVIEQQHKALERMHLWAESQADAQSKGGHATFDLMRLREERDAMIPALAAGKQALEQTQGEVEEPVAWFAFADSNGPVPLELYGWDEKACKYAVLMNARSVGWKGTVEGYLLAQNWTVKPVYTHPQATEPAPSTAGERAATLERFERLAHRKGELWERCQGKGWPDAESGEFTSLRDEKLPALRAALLSAPALPIGERQRFEAWLRSKWEIGSEFPNTINGVYTHGEAQRFWVCWQAAARTQPVREQK